jgi:hypothetical protein
MLASKEGKSRGMAFVELSCESDVHSALRLHHSQVRVRARARARVRARVRVRG